MRTVLKQYEQRILAWASAHPAIHVAIACGSNERQVNPADDWSDLDIELYVTDFADFRTSTDWLKGFGTLWMHLFQEDPEGPVFLAVYQGGEKIDFHFYTVDALKQQVDTQHLHDAYQRGYRVIVDKTGLAMQLPEASRTGTPLERPAESEFMLQIRRFWYGALYEAKQIRRRNLWVVRSTDWRIKQPLLTLLEWHAQSRNAWQVDTWHEGHFLAQWTDADTWRDLHAVFGHFDTADSWHALFAGMTLFRRLGQELAQNLGYAYPAELDANFANCIQALREDDPLT